MRKRGVHLHISVIEVASANYVCKIDMHRCLALFVCFFSSHLTWPVNFVFTYFVGEKVYRNRTALKIVQKCIFLASNIFRLSGGDPIQRLHSKIPPFQCGKNVYSACWQRRKKPCQICQCERLCAFFEGARMECIRFSIPIISYINFIHVAVAQTTLCIISK